MDEREKMKKIPVEYDEEGFNIDEARLNEYLKGNLDELKEHASDHKEIPKTRLMIGGVIGFCIMLAILALTFRGALLLAFILGALTLLNIGPILKWIEGEK